MNKLMTLGLGIAVVLFSSTGTLLASTSGHDESKSEHNEMPKTAKGVWKAINEETEELGEIIEHGKLNKVHLVAFRIRDLANSLPALSKGIVEDIKTLQTYLDRIGKHAANLDKYGDAGNATKTKKEYDAFLKRLQGLAELYPHEIADAGKDEHGSDEHSEEGHEEEEGEAHHEKEEQEDH